MVNFNPPNVNLGYPISFITGDSECSGGCSLENTQEGTNCSLDGVERGGGGSFSGRL